MVETLESKIRKLEAKNGPTSDDDITFDIFLVKPKEDGSMLRRSWPEGKYKKIDPKSLGIAPYKPMRAAPKVVEPPVAINVPKEEEYAPAPVEDEDDIEAFYRWWESLER